jgi:hypothetical protein
MWMHRLRISAYLAGGQVITLHAGIGIAALAAWWLASKRAWEGVIEAAAAPARTTENAKMRIAVFMISASF